MEKTFIYNVMKYGEKQKHEELKELVLKSSLEFIMNTIKFSIKYDSGVNFWNYLLKGFDLCSDDESFKKRFHCVEMLLKELNITELSYKQTYDIITRLCSELICFKNDELIAILDICFESIKFGQSNLVWWKDIFPETLELLSLQTNLDLEGRKIDGLEYKIKIIQSLLHMKWNSKNLTPLANMIADLKLNNDDTILFLTKFSKELLNLTPVELPPLSYQLFCMCNSASHLLIPLLALEKYFNHLYYKKLFIDFESDSTCFENIDEFSEKDILEAEENILHHLSFCTRHRIKEEQLSILLRNFISTPETILTPFMISAIISVTESNRNSDDWNRSSCLFSIFENSIKNNEEQITMSKNCAWCQDTFQTDSTNITQMFTILIDQNKDGKDLTTPGLINLVFVLLKSNSKRLQYYSISFLSQFIKKRFLFGYGVIKILTEWLVNKLDFPQYNECLIALAHSDPYTVSESFKTIKNVLDFFEWIPEEKSLKIISFLIPVIKISQPVREAYIDIMKKAIYSQNLEKCHLGVYGFCRLLEQLNVNNSQQSTGTNFMSTQQCISGYSLMSQANFVNRSYPQRHFDILVLEIIGSLRKCFGAPLIIKETLYENLSRAVLINSKLAPHLLEFIEMHFRGYFKVDESETLIFFDKIILKDFNSEEIIVRDNIGKLIMLISSIILVCEKNEIVHNNALIKTIITTLTDRIISKDYKLIDKCCEPLLFHTRIQELYLLEGLIYYLLWTSKTSNDHINKISCLFEEHLKLQQLIHGYSKNCNKKKENFDYNDMADLSLKKSCKTISRKNIFKIENIWDLLTLERFLKLFNDGTVSFAMPGSVFCLKSNSSVYCYILEITSDYFKELQHQPEYKQVRLSQRIFNQICVVTKLIYECCIKNLVNLWRNYNETAAYWAVECFYQSLLTVQKIKPDKYDLYIKEVDVLTGSDSKDKLHNVIQQVFEESIKENENDQKTITKNIPITLLKCLEIIYDFIKAGTSLSLEIFDWLYEFCQKYKVSKSYSLIYKLLFDMRLKTHSGSFFDTIAVHIANLLGTISDQKLSTTQFNFKALTLTSVSSCHKYLLNSFRKQLHFTDFFISKAKSMLFNHKFIFEQEKEIFNINLKTMERAICTQLTHISSGLIHLTNIDTPLGENMDNLLRVLIQFYVSLNNLTKHLMSCYSSLQISLSIVKYDQLVRFAGKPLASRIYTLILNIDEKNNMCINNNKKQDPKVGKSKILKHTKFLPKLILRIENFNKNVIFISKKTGVDLTPYLHIGTVRDFRIKTKNLKEAIDKILSHNSQIERNAEESSSNSDNDNDNNDKLRKNRKHLVEENNTAEKINSKKTSHYSTDDKSYYSSDENEDSLISETPAMGVLNEKQSDESAGLKFLQNVAKVTAKGQKRIANKMRNNETKKLSPTKKSARGSKKKKSS